MATIDPIRKFAKQVMTVEGVLREYGITADCGRILFVLTMANHLLGATQKEVVDATALPKDVVSKSVRKLVNAGLLTQERESTKKRLLTTRSSRELLSLVRASLSPPSSAIPESKKKAEYSNPFADLL